MDYSNRIKKIKDEVRDMELARARAEERIKTIQQQLEAINQECKELGIELQDLPTLEEELKQKLESKTVEAENTILKIRNKEVY